MMMAVGKVGPSSEAEQTWHGIVLQALKRNDISLVPYVPDRVLTTLIRNLHADPFFTTFPTAREEEAVGIVAGAWMGGKMPLMLMESTGILVATYALLRCHTTFGLPTLLLSTYRGDLGEQEWYAVHTGSALPGILAAMKIPSKVIDKIDDLKPVLLAISEKHKLEYAYINDTGEGGGTNSDWVLITRYKPFILRKEIVESTVPVAPQPDWRLWTDDFNNLIQVFKH
jgi:sulfopyruvate decarboxylase TPP-binding subunit